METLEPNSGTGNTKATKAKLEALRLRKNNADAQHNADVWRRTQAALFEMILDNHRASEGEAILLEQILDAADNDENEAILALVKLCEERATELHATRLYYFWARENKKHHADLTAQD